MLGTSLIALQNQSMKGGRMADKIDKNYEVLDGPSREELSE